MTDNPSPYEPRYPAWFCILGERMAYKYIETQDDVNEFVNYIARSGGRVTKILALRQGFQFDIVGPSHSSKFWGRRALDQFLSNREGVYEDAGHS